MHPSRIGRLRWTRSRRRASTVVEFAVISPLLITLLFGIIEFGWAFMVRQIVTNAAREGARVAAVQSPEGVNDAEIVQAVVAAMGALEGMVTITADDVDITHWCKDSDGNPDFTETVRVTVPYDDISLLGDFFGWINFNDIVGISSMRKEGVTEDSDPPGSGLCES